MCERKNTMYWGACVRVDTFNSALELSLRVNSRLCLVHFPIDPVLWPWVGSFVVVVDWLWRINLALEFLFLLCINFTTRESLQFGQIKLFSFLLFRRRSLCWC